MKIAIILPALANKGPILVARDIVNYLKDKVEYIEVFYFDETSGALVFPCKCSHLAFKSGKKFQDFDIVFTHGLRPVLYAWLFLKDQTVKTVTTIHGYLFEEFGFQYGKAAGWIFARIYLLLLNAQDKIVCLSKEMEKYYGRYFSANKLAVIYNGRPRESGSISPGDVEKIMALKKNGAVVGVASALIKRKALDQLVRAMIINQRFSLLIIGDGPQKAELQKIASDAGILSRCLFLGYRNNAHYYFPYFDIFAITSKSEGFPLALLEGINAGLPIVCPGTPIFKEILAQDEAAFFDLDDPNTLSDALTVAWDQRESLSKKVEALQSRYSCEKMGSEYEKLFKDILKQISLT